MKWVVLVGCLAFSVSASENDVAISEESAASSYSVSLTDHILVSDAADPLDKEKASIGTLMHEAWMRAEVGTTSANIHFSNQFSPSVSNTEKHFNLEKKSLAHDWDSVELRLGDSHQELGRGIALSLYENPAFGIDNTLEGAALKVRGSGFDGGVFAGRINALKAPVAINPVDSKMAGRNVYLGSVQLGADLSASSQLGAHYLLMISEKAGKPIDLRQHTFGAHYTSALSDSVELYAELNAAYPELVDRQGYYILQPTAWGNFASLTWTPVPWKTKLEIKDYRQFNMDFQRPPTLEEDIVASINNTDVTAARLGVERQLADGRSSIFSSWLSGQDRQYQAMVNHPVLGTKLKFDNRNELEVKGGYRWISDRNRLLHASTKGKIRTFKGQAVELGIRKQDLEEALNSPVPIRTERNIADITYTFSENFNLGFAWEYVPTNAADAGQHFASLQGTYKTGALTARGFLGETSGGVQCSAGVCRQVPPFTGAYIDTSLSF